LKRETQICDSPVPVSHRDTCWSQGKKEVKVQLQRERIFVYVWNIIVFFCHVTLELLIRPPWMEGETQIHKSPVPVPTRQTTSSQAGKKIRVWL
jgi:hypothetical protein